ncbi:hypothetical protein RE628_24570 [Paenibacillus sp. D2_2]|uniref:hypothetical protein n=1 Tax=Paenibacillus sp. D2_2 TaxID=3073092 RepID=UPI0028163612|nr:hypothetical protein [Paenibacillus sp. D2_2]WMT40350.1 hypothetical protein RE628_24570 [Paenibacillus sp. D2_2]
MTENNEPKKIDLAEAMRQKLQQKKEQQLANKSGAKNANQIKTLKTQNNKKPNNQRRRTGGS